MLAVNIIQTFTDHINSLDVTWVNAIFRLTMSVVLGMVIGYERKRKGQIAGIRTFALMSMGACLAMLLSIYVPQVYLGLKNGDPSRIAAQVITGVGFIGGGAMIQNKGSVRGLTTAAGIWITAVIGMAIGVGMYLCGVVATILCVVILVFFERAEQVRHIGSDSKVLKRYDRTKYLKLPKIDFYQLRVNYVTQQLEAANPVRDIPNADKGSKLAQAVVKTTDLTMETQTIQVDDEERGTVPATFSAWLMDIVKGSFGTLTMAQLKPHEDELRVLFNAITYERDGSRYYSSKFDRRTVEANVRKAFCDRRSFTTTEELIPQESSLLNIANFTSTVSTTTPEDYYPKQDLVERIILDDKGKLKVDANTKKLMELAEATGNTAILEMLRKQSSSHPQKNRSFHYLPYRTDSSFEQTFLDQVLAMAEVENLDLEVYYNGDRAMTEFKIKCYKGDAGAWRYVGMYTPDFLIVKRKNGKIHKAIIVETKGAIYANDPTFKDKRSFMEREFTRQNNKAFGYERFEYLYLEDSFPEAERIRLTHEKICAFFKEKP